MIIRLYGDMLINNRFFVLTPSSIFLNSSFSFKWQTHHTPNSQTKSNVPTTSIGVRFLKIPVMMMLGERMLTHNNQNYPIPAIQIPIGYDEEEFDDDWDLLVMDAYTCDDFRMFEFKVRLCARGRSHDWTECPYAHPGEKARRRDPRKYRYSGTACPEFRKGSCKRGDGCEFAHGVFECWLHPTRYRTQPCKDGVGCRRRVCFFAHTPEQLRVLTAVGGGSEGVESYDGSPLRVKQRGVVLSPTSTLIGFGGYPVSPNRSENYGSPPISPTVEEVMMGIRKMGISRSPAMTGSSWIREMEAFDFGRRNTISGSDDDRYRTLMKEKLGLEDIVDEPDWFSDLMN